MAKIEFVSEELEVEVDPGMTLLDLANEVDCDITFGCRSGSCGTCRVRVVGGAENLSPMRADERDFLAGFQARADERLACQVTVQGDCKIEYVGLDDLE